MAAVAALSSANLSAQTCSFLNMPADMRSTALGGISVAAPSSAINPSASLLSSDRASFGASYVMWQPSSADMKLFNGGTFFNASHNLSFSLGFVSATHTVQTAYNDDGTSAGTFTPAESSFRIGAAYRIAGMMVVSVTGKMVSSNMGKGTAGKAFAGDLALIFRKDGITLAAGVDNLGSKMTYGKSEYSLPMRIKGGAGSDFNFGVSRVSANAEAGFIPAQYSGASSDFYACAGLEYCFDNIVSARAGYHFDQLEAGYVSLGVGARFFGVGLDGFYLLSGSGSPVAGAAGLGLSYSF